MEAVAVVGPSETGVVPSGIGSRDSRGVLRLESGGRGSVGAVVGVPLMRESNWAASMV